MAIEAATVDGISELIAEFDRHYTDLVEASKAIISAFFTTVRDLESVHHDRVASQARFRLPLSARATWHSSHGAWASRTIHRSTGDLHAWSR